MPVTGVLSRSTPEIPRLFFRIGANSIESRAKLKQGVGDRMQGARGSRLSLRLIRLWRKQAEGSKQKAKS